MEQRSKSTIVRRVFCVVAMLVPMLSGFVSAERDHVVSAADPVQVPDGKIVYVVQRGPGSNYVSEIWIAESDGSAPRQLTTGYFDTEPQWSPDGKVIAFTRSYPVDGSVPFPDDTRSEVLAVFPEGGTPAPLVLPPEGVFFDRIERLLSWTDDGTGVIFERHWRDNPFGPIVYIGGTYATGGAVPVATPFPVPDAAASPHCAEPGPGYTPQRDFATAYPDPDDERVLIQSSLVCSNPNDRFVEAGIGVYGTSGPASPIAITYPQLYPAPWGRNLKPDQFTANDWSADGTEIYDGAFWAAPATGGSGACPAIRHAVPDRSDPECRLPSGLEPRRLALDRAYRVLGACQRHDRGNFPGGLLPKPWRRADRCLVHARTDPIEHRDLENRPVRYGIADAADSKPSE